MEGTWSPDNCYILTNDLTCHQTKVDQAKLWHQKLGHMNFRDMEKLMKLEVVWGIPRLKIDHEGVFGACAVGK